MKKKNTTYQSLRNAVKAVSYLFSRFLVVHSQTAVPAAANLSWAEAEVFTV